jgi:methyl-accepting chemotaxis protein
MFSKTGSIRTKLLISVGLASGFVAVALAIALVGNHNVAKSFTRFIEHDQAKLGAYTQMYAHGMQGGLALRNIVLNPANKNFYDVLDKANKDFNEAYESAVKLSEGDADTTAVLKEIDGHWHVAGEAKNQVRELAGKDPAAAIRTINEQETPAWRDTRALLLKLIDGQNQAVQAMKAEIDGNARMTFIISLILGAVAIVVGSLMVMAVAQSVKRSLDEVSQSMADLAAGAGDLTKRMVVSTADEVGRTSMAFNRFMEGLQGIIRHVREDSERLASAASELSATAANVAQASHTQSEASAATASAVEEITASIGSVAQSAEDVRNLSNKGLDSTQQGNRALSQLVGEINVVESAVNSIADSVREFVKSTQTITNMTKQVKDIAEQTNLLALNAAIEAARAGEQGRGFAVVADEVRKLAEKSSHSASEIDTVTRVLGQQSESVDKAIQAGLQSLRTSQDTVEHVTTVLAEANKAVTHANQGVDGITRSVREQTTASADISRNIERIARMTEENSHAMSEVSVATHELERLAGELENIVSNFRV